MNHNESSDVNEKTFFFALSVCPTAARGELRPHIAKGLHPNNEGRAQHGAYDQGRITIFSPKLSDPACTSTHHKDDDFTCLSEPIMQDFGAVFRWIHNVFHVVRGYWQGDLRVR